MPSAVLRYVFIFRTLQCCKRSASAKYTIHYELRVTNYELRITSCDLRFFGKKAEDAGGAVEGAAVFAGEVDGLPIGADAVHAVDGGFPVVAGVIDGGDVVPRAEGVAEGVGPFREVAQVSPAGYREGAPKGKIFE